MTARRPVRHRPKHAPRVPFALLVVGLIVGGMCALLALNTASAANELNRHDLALKDADISAQLQQLQNEVAASAAPGALGSAAAELGMVPAGNPAFLQVGADGTVRLLGSPAPATAQPLPVIAAPKVSKASTPSPAKSSNVPTSVLNGHTPKPTTSSTAKSKPTPPPATPTTTPTPTTTLPGGTR